MANAKELYGGELRVSQSSFSLPPLPRSLLPLTPSDLLLLSCRLFADPHTPTDAGADPSLSDDDDSNSDSEDDIPGAPKADEATYEASDLITTVVVEPFSLSRSASPILRARSDSGSPGPEGEGVEEKKKRMEIRSVHKKRVKNKPQSRPKMSRDDKKERAKGGKKVKAGFLKGSAGTKGRSNK